MKTKMFKESCPLSPLTLIAVAGEVFFVDFIVGVVFPSDSEAVDLQMTVAGVF